MPCCRLLRHMPFSRCHCLLLLYDTRAAAMPCRDAAAMIMLIFFALTAITRSNATAELRQFHMSPLSAAATPRYAMLYYTIYASEAMSYLFTRHCHAAVVAIDMPADGHTSAPMSFRFITFSAALISYAPAYIYALCYVDAIRRRYEMSAMLMLMPLMSCRYRCCHVSLFFLLMP